MFIRCITSQKTEQNHWKFPGKWQWEFTQGPKNSTVGPRGFLLTVNQVSKLDNYPIPKTCWRAWVAGKRLQSLWLAYAAGGLRRVVTKGNGAREDFATERPPARKIWVFEFRPNQKRTRNLILVNHNLLEALFSILSLMSISPFDSGKGWFTRTTHHKHKHKHKRKKKYVWTALTSVEEVSLFFTIQKSN